MGLAGLAASAAPPLPSMAATDGPACWAATRSSISSCDTTQGLRKWRRRPSAAAPKRSQSGGAKFTASPRFTPRLRHRGGTGGMVRRGVV